MALARKNSAGFPAIIPLLFGPVAQLVEQRIENPRVDGSIPSQATKIWEKINGLRSTAWPVFLCVVNRANGFGRLASGRWSGDIWTQCPVIVTRACPKMRTGRS